jgi:hypothetical protein
VLLYQPALRTWKLNIKPLLSTSVPSSVPTIPLQSSLLANTVHSNMPRRIDDNGLVLSLIKLNGRLELRFTRDNTFSAQYTLHGTETDDTLDMEYAREAAAGQPVVSLGLEMFVEETPGFLEVRFEGAIGSTLAFQYDGREFGDSPTNHSDTPANSIPAFSGHTGTMNAAYAQHPLTASLSGQQDYQMTQMTTRDAKVQTLLRVAKVIEVQTPALSAKYAAVQTKAPRLISTGVQTANVTGSMSEEDNLFPTIVDLTGQEEHISAAKNDSHEQKSTEPEATQTFTNAVATVFQTFNEPRNPYRQKRQAHSATDYRAYKHISSKATATVTARKKKEDCTSTSHTIFSYGSPTTTMKVVLNSRSTVSTCLDVSPPIIALDYCC